MSKFFKFIVVNIVSMRWFNPFLTLWFNFFFLPFKQAIHLPVFIYGWPRFLGSLSTKIQISAPYIYRRMIIINQDNESSYNGDVDTEFVLNGAEIIFRGNAYIGCGCRIMMYSNSSIIFGNDFRMHNCNSIASRHSISFGDNVGIGHCNQFFDTDFHYLFDINTEIVKNNMRAILVGDNCWVTNHCTIMKGVQLPSNTIVASNTVVNKSLTIDSFTIWGNNRIIRKGIARIFNREIEGRISDYFMSGNNFELQLDEELNVIINR